MSLKVTKFKKPNKRNGTTNKRTPVEAFLESCDIQSRIVGGETVAHKVTKKPIKSWVRDVYGEKALIPKVGTSLLLGKGRGFTIDDNMTAKKILVELKKEVNAGKYVRIINKLARGAKRRPRKAK